MHMKKITRIMLSFTLLAATLSPSVFACATTSTSKPWQPPVHNQWLDFQASYQNGVVNMTWNKFVPQSSSWNYYKVVRSTDIQQPYYPDNGYIKAIGDQNQISYTDSNPPAGTVYYGVCAITTSDRGKHRNCDRQAVTVDGTSSDGTTTSEVGAATPPVTTVVTVWLSDAMKGVIDSLMNKFKEKLSNKFASDIGAKKAFLSALLPVIDNVISSASGQNRAMFEYLKTKVVEYQAVVELEDILDVE